MQLFSISFKRQKITSFFENDVLIRSEVTTIEEVVHGLPQATVSSYRQNMPSTADVQVIGSEFLDGQKANRSQKRASSSGETVDLRNITSTKTVETEEVSMIGAGNYADLVNTINS